MIFWHMAGSVLLFRYLFRDPGVDLRFLVAGAIVSDVIDKPIGRIVWADYFQTGRIYGHTLVFFSFVLLLAMILTNRGTGRRRQWVVFAVGIMFHLLLDGMWAVPETLLWPLFGWSFPPSIDDYWSGFFVRVLTDPIVIGQEVAGLVYLRYLWRKANLSDSQRRLQLKRTGVIVT